MPSIISIPLIKKSMSPWKNLTICCYFISADRLCFQFLTRRKEKRRKNSFLEQTGGAVLRWKVNRCSSSVLVSEQWNVELWTAFCKQFCKFVLQSVNKAWPGENFRGHFIFSWSGFVAFVWLTLIFEMIHASLFVFSNIFKEIVL